jgi:hypothetical protein
MVLAAGVLLLLFPTAAAQDPSLPGDADGDGYLTFFDLEAILDHIMEQTSAAGDPDANGDGKVDIADWVQLNSFLFPSAPSAYLGSVLLQLSEERVSPGGSLTASWEIAPLLRDPDVEVLLRTRRPGSVITSGDERTFTPGVVPANGTLFHRTSTGEWLAQESVLSQNTGPDSRSFSLPTEDEGEWQIEVLVRAADSKRMLAIAQETVVAGSRPTIRLTLNRPIANPNDYIGLALDILPGAEAREVAILGRLIHPDGEVWALPTESPDSSLPIFEGAATKTHIPLLNRHFSGLDQGLYRVEMKMYGPQGGLLSLANAGFEVCDSSATITGTVPGLGEVDPENEAVANVRAIDIDDAAGGGIASISSDGSFELILDPGRYLLRAAVGGTESLLTGDQPLTVPCGGQAVEVVVPLETAATQSTSGIQTKAAPWHQIRAAQATAGVPNPKVFFVIIPEGTESDKAKAEILADLALAALISTHPNIDQVSDRDLAQMAALSETQTLLGDVDGAEERLQDIGGAMGTQFVAPLGVSIIRTPNDGTAVVKTALFT